MTRGRLPAERQLAHLDPPRRRKIHDRHHGEGEHEQRHAPDQERCDVHEAERRRVPGEDRFVGQALVRREELRRVNHERAAEVVEVKLLGLARQMPEDELGEVGASGDLQPPDTLDRHPPREHSERLQRDDRRQRREEAVKRR